MTLPRFPRLLGAALALVAAGTASANNTAQTLPFAQDWSNTGLITANNNWSGVPGIEGFQGIDITTSTGVDPQTLLAADDSSALHVVANTTSTGSAAGTAEFEIANPTIGLAGSGTADAPYIRLYLNTTGQSGISVRYNVRDIETTDNAIQQVALHYRLGS